jgi:hypothetical protein
MMGDSSNETVTTNVKESWRPKLHARWTPAEDEFLKHAIQTCGTRDWHMVADRLEGRNARQCRERWENYLRGDLKHEQWTLEEDRLLLQKHRELNGRWVEIAKVFENRTDSMVKNRFNLLRRHHKKRLEIMAGRDAVVFQLLYLRESMTAGSDTSRPPALPTPIVKPQAVHPPDELDLRSDDWPDLEFTATFLDSEWG